MPEIFKGCIPEPINMAAQRLITELYTSQTSFKEEVAKTLLKLRASYKKDVTGFEGITYCTDFVLLDPHNKDKIILLIHANSINPGSKKPNGFERFKFAQLNGWRTKDGGQLKVLQISEADWIGKTAREREVMIYPFIADDYRRPKIKVDNYEKFIQSQQ